MADGTQSSFFVPSYLLSQVPEQDRQAVISDAQKAFFLNLFGPSGGPGAAYQASQNVGLGYLQAQEAARKAQQARQAQEAQRFAAGLINPPENISGPMALGAADLGRAGPTQARANVVGAPNPAAAVPVEQRYRQAALGVGSFAPEFASQLAGIAEKAGPRYQYQEGLRVDMNAPKQAFIPKLEPGESFLFDANGNIAGIQNVQGKVQALSERSRASESAKAEFSVETVMGPDGKEYKVPRSAITGTFNGVRPTVGGVPGAGGITSGATGGAPRTGGRAGGMLSGLSPEEKAVQEANVKFAFNEVLVPAKQASDAAGKANQALGTLARIVESTPVNKITSNEWVQSIGGYLKAAGLVTPDASLALTNLSTINGLVSSTVLEKQLAQKGPQTEADARRLEATIKGMGDKEATLFLVNFDRALNAMTQEKYKFILDQRAKGNILGAEEAWINRPDAGQSIFRRPELKKYAEIREMGGKRYRVFGDGGPVEEVR